MRKLLLLLFVLFLLACASSVVPEAAPSEVKERVVALGSSLESLWGNGVAAPVAAPLSVSAMPLMNPPESVSPMPLMNRLTPVSVSPTPLMNPLTALSVSPTPLMNPPVSVSPTPLMNRLTPVSVSPMPLMNRLTPVSVSPTPLMNRLTPVFVSPTPLMNRLTPVPIPVVEGEWPLSGDGDVVQPRTIAELSQLLGEVETAFGPADLLKGRTRWWWDDLNGDGLDEWVVRLKEPGLEGSLPWGSPARILIADPAKERVVYEAASEDFESLELLLLDDFTGDGLPEVLYQITSCGAHTCYQAYYLISYQQSNPPRELRFVFAEGSDKSYPLVNMSSSEWFVEDWTGDELPDLVLHGGMIGSAAAGVQRARTELYGWDGQVMRLVEVTFESSILRYFVLLDANEALRLGNYDMALLLYDEIILSEEFADSRWPAKNGTRSERIAIEQYAGFRLVLNFLIQDDLQNAKVRLNWLLTTYPNAPMSEAAQLLYDQYVDSEDLVAACAAVTEYGQSVPDITSPLDDRGYANPALTAETLCPLRK